MGDEDHGDAQLPVDVPDELQDGMSGIGVQSAGGLVTQQYLRVGGQSPDGRLRFRP